MSKTTDLKLELNYNQVKGFKINDYQNVSENTLKKLGINADMLAVNDFKKIVNDCNYSMDSDLVTIPNISNLVQFFQYWYPEVIEILTSARKIDEIVGRTIAGDWEDEEIVNIILEKTGTPKLYGDHTNIPLTSWNENFERRNIVRLELGCESGILEELRASKMKINSNNEKKASVALSLAIEMNKIGFYGYNNGSYKTYGLLNDPNLPSYITVNIGAGGDTTWESKTFEEILADIQNAIQQVTTQLKGLFDNKKDGFQIVLGTSRDTFLNKPNALGTDSIYSYLKRTYPNIRFVFAPEFDNAENGDNIFYVIVDKVNGKDTIKQFIQDAFRLLGVERKAKAVLEDYSCSSAGVIVRYPLGVVRYIGI